jgi:hypothetical protein
MVEGGERLSKGANHDQTLGTKTSNMLSYKYREEILQKDPFKKPQIHSLSRERARAL